MMIIPNIWKNDPFMDWYKLDQNGGCFVSTKRKTYKKLLKMVIYSGFTHEKWWFSIVMLVNQ
jgi:hypothetical protein